MANSKKKMGRPLKEIDVDLFEHLCKMMCTEEEIAGAFKCSVDTIDRFCKRTYGRTFADTFKTYSADGKISLRRYQFKLAETDSRMAIFLGKQYLGQSDKISQTITSVSNETRDHLSAIMKEIDEEYQGAVSETAEIASS